MILYQLIINWLVNFTLIFNGGYVLARKEIYMAVVTDLAAAQAFSVKYLSYKVPPGEKLNYPKFMIDEIAKAFNSMDSYLTESSTKAKAVILDKYNAGISFFKQGGNGIYYPLKVKEVKQADGSKKYTLIPCS